MKSVEPLDRPSNYQARDAEVIDYGMVQLPGTQHLIRGPLPDLSRGDQITFLGAAQTFGCFCEAPFPTLIGQALDRPVLNLGFGGAGPGFFTDHPELIDIANRGALTVVQVLSGRVQPNLFFEGRGLARVRMKRNGQHVHPHVAWNDIAEGFYIWRRLPAMLRPAVHLAARAPLALAIAQSRAGWIGAYRALFQRLTTPTLLVWFSRRTPEYPRRPRPGSALMGEYPQLVSRDWVAPVAAMVDAYTEVVSDRGTPQQLTSRTTGQPVSIDLGRDSALYAGGSWTENSYYPTPAMNEDAAAALLPAVRRLLGK
jgi:hypothetical protein